MNFKVQFFQKTINFFWYMAVHFFYVGKFHKNPFCVVLLVCFGFFRLLFGKKVLYLPRKCCILAKKQSKTPKTDKKDDTKRIFMKLPYIKVHTKSVWTTKRTTPNFNGSFYEQIDGVGMGSPIAPAFADIFMNYRIYSRIGRNFFLIF